MTGRIPQAFIDDLLDRTDIVDLIGERLELRRAGSNHKALCPFHDEKTPSFSVNGDRQFYYCFGCNAGGNAIGFLMAYDHLDFVAAVRYLADRAGLEIPREAAPAEDRHAPLLATLQRAQDFFRDQLSSHPAAPTATAYLRRRGVSTEIAAEYGVGFAPPGWDNLLKALATDGESTAPSELVTAGLAVARESGSGHYDRFRHRLIFPIRDLRGRVVGFGGRVLGDDQPKYLNSPETPVFHKGRELYGLYEARRHRHGDAPALVVEGYMDVLALAQFGFRNTVATLGTALTEEHLHKLFRHTGDLVFSFDGDAAGRRAARRALEICLPALRDGRTARFLFLPEGEDPDTVVRKLGPEAFRDRVDTALPLSEFLFEIAAEDLDLGLPDHRARFCQRAMPLIQRLPEGVLKHLLVGELADRTGLPREALGQLGQAPEQRPAEPPTRPQPAGLTLRRAQVVPGCGSRTPLARHLLALLLHDPGIGEPLAEDIARLQADNPDLELLHKVHRVLLDNPGYSLVHLLSYWHGMHGAGERDLLARIAASDLLHATPSAPGDRLAEARGILARLREAQERERPPEVRLRALLARAELAAEDRARVRALILELSRSDPKDPLIQEAKQRVADGMQ
jgi:DNA primase